MKRITRIVDIAAVVVFLVALASNCLQASQVSLDSAVTSVPAFTQSGSVNADQSDSLIADDESAGTPTLVLIHSTITFVKPVPSPALFTAVSVVGVKVQQPAVLRI